MSRSPLASDFLVIGAGIVGLTVAYELNLRFPESRISIVEKEKKPGMHASGRNSGVLHSGIYYAQDTLKAKACAQGAQLMRDFAAENNIPCKRSGKVIIATSDSDLVAVDRLVKNAQDNQIRIEVLDEAGVRSFEPHATPHKVGIWSPDTAVIDSKAVVLRLAAILESKGVQFFFEESVIECDPAVRTVRSTTRRFSYGHLFNCAGAYADLIAHQYGLAENYVLVPFKGLYHKLVPERAFLVRSNIYPLPDLRQPFLGVHLTRVINGDVYVGPTAIPALGRENYGIVAGARLSEAVGIAWQLTKLYVQNQQDFRRLVRTEMKKYLKAHFVDAARRLCAELKADDLVPTDKVGIRPQLVNLKERKLEMDYILETADHSTHVLNSISPAFTSAFAFSRLIVDRARLS